MANYYKKKESLSDVFRGISSGVTSVFVFIILTIFPLYTHDMYFDILGARYMFFKVWSILLCAILLFLGILYLVIDFQNRASFPTAFRRFVDAFKPENIKKHIMLTDIFFIIMIISMIISTIGTDFKEEAFFGNAGRYQGLECWIYYFLTYIAITRTYKFKLYHLDFAILSGVFSSIWGILDFFKLDPFGFFRNVSTLQQAMFASSIGNLNTFTNYTIMIFALAATLFIIEKRLVRSIFYFICALIASVGTICGFADNAVLGFFGFYLFLPFFAFKNRRMLLRYLISIDMLFISLFIFWIANKFPHNDIQSSFFLDFIRIPNTCYLFIPFTIFVVIVGVVLYKMKPTYDMDMKLYEDNNLNVNINPLDSKLPRQIKLIYMIIVLIGFILVTYIILDMNVFKQHVDLWSKLPSSGQLVFNDNWGTHRGHNWRIAFTNFKDNFSWFQRLFGYGPDTYLIVSERTFYEEMVQRYGEVYDSAHNEYINYLICEGLIGLISYLGIFITALRTGVKNIINNIFILAPIMAVIAYMVQAVVNIAIPITTPVFFVFMYMCAAMGLNKKEVSV